MSWLRRRRPVPAPTPARTVNARLVLLAIADCANDDHTPAPPGAPGVPLTMAGRGRPLDRPPLLVAGAGHNPLPFGMAVYPDSPLPPEPWFAGPTPAPDRILPSQDLGDDV